MSISMMFLILNLILEGDFHNYFQRIKKNKLLLLVISFYLLHILGVLWSNNLAYVSHDLRAKLPMFVIPIALVAKPIMSKIQLNIVLYIFVGTLLVSSLINYACYYHWIGNFHYDDIRGMSLFNSHVRYALLISMAAAILLFTLTKTNKLWFTLQIIVIAWFAYYTLNSQVISGYLSFAGVALVGIVYWVWKWNKIVALSFIGISIISCVVLAVWIFQPVEMNKEIIAKLPYRSIEGNVYYHAPENIAPETKKPIEINICDVELKREWEKHSKIPYDGRDLKNQLIRTTLIRYLASMDVDKDAVGFAKLKKEDIQKIENGCASIYCTGVLARAYGLKYQLINAENPNGHSLLQRLEYWKTGLEIAQSNFLIGVGTGDIQDKFDELYTAKKSLLNQENRRRTHNMFLTTLITFGIFGLFLFLWIHTEFIVQQLNTGNLVGVSFFTIAVLSYLTEDTLETQTGVTFFALFYGLFSTTPKD